MSKGIEKAADPRTRRLKVGVLASMVNRGTATLAPIITVPVSLQYLGASAYGAWAAALALTAVAVFADFGIGAGLMTKLSVAVATGERGRAKQLVSTAYVGLICAVAVAVAALWATMPFVDWAAIIGGTSAAGNEQIEIISLVTLSGFLANVAASLIVRVQYAAQQIALSNLWQVGGSLLSVTAIFVAARLDPGSGIFVAIAVFVPILWSGVNASVFFAGKTGRYLAPAPQHFRINELRELTSIGGRFLLISLLMSIGLSADSWIVAQAISVSAVPDYAVPARIFAVLPLVVSVFAAPLWPLIGEALSKGDIAWIRSITRKTAMLSTSLVAALALIGLIAGPLAIAWWLGGAIAPSHLLLAGFGLMGVLQSIASPWFMTQNAAGVLGPQTIGFALYALTLPVKWWVSSQWGVDWIALVGATGYAVFVLPSAYVGYRRTMNRAATNEYFAPDARSEP